ncbi:hypothetical protein [Rhodospirillum sp. A1_3_36]|uniref:hypothetical protein n=1 Tax=Rhodospirillum sp. A1_3_36 TaxID=3391666 RepID=UPI0039A6A1F4
MIFGSYLLLCLVVAFAGRRRRLGFFGYFFVAAMLTPFVGLLILLFGRMDQNRDQPENMKLCKQCEKEYKKLLEKKYCPHCGCAM